MTAGQNDMKKTIAAYDFALYEMNLYLDTHPQDRRALNMLEKYRQGREVAVQQYEKLFGPYVVTANNTPTGNRWSWVDDPWPWEFKGGE